MVRHPFRRLVSGYSEKMERDWEAAVLDVDVIQSTVDFRNEILRASGITPSQ